MPRPRLTRLPEVTLDINTGDVVTSGRRTDRPIEGLAIDPSPTPEGFRYEIINDVGEEYRVVAEWEGSDLLYGKKASTRRGILPVPSCYDKQGRWRAYLIRNGHVVDEVAWDMVVTLRNYVDSMGQVEIRFSDTDGPMGRLGQIRVQPWNRSVQPLLQDSRPEFAVIVHFMNLPREIPRSATYTLDLVAPSGDVFHTEEPLIAMVGGFKLRVRGTPIGNQPGRWMVFVRVDGRQLASNQFTIQSTGVEHPAEEREAVEQFIVAI